MENIIKWLADSSITAGFIILIVLALRPCIKRMPKWVNLMLWLIVALRLVMPVGVESRFSLVPDIGDTAVRYYEGFLKTEKTGKDGDIRENAQDYEDPAGDNAQEAAEEEGLYGEDRGLLQENLTKYENSNKRENTAERENPDGQEEIQESQNLTARGYMSEQADEIPDVEAAAEKEGSFDTNESGIGAVIFMIWLSGIAGMLGYIIISRIKIAGSVRFSVPKESVRDIAERPLAPVYVCERIKTPFVIGLLKKRIYVPEGMDEADLKYVIRHENSHIEHHDQWWKLIGFLLLAIYWFNPLVWAAFICFSKDIELACDERAVKEMDTDERTAYSLALLNCAVRVERLLRFCPVAFGENGVKSRIKAVLKMKKPLKIVSFLAVIGCAVFAVCFLTNPASGKSGKDGSVAIEDDAAEEELTDSKNTLGINENDQAEKDPISKASKEETSDKNTAENDSREEKDPANDKTQKDDTQNGDDGKDAVVKSGTQNGAAGKDTAVKDNTQKDAIGKDTAIKGDVKKDNTIKENPEKTDNEEGDIKKNDTGKEGKGKESTGKDNTGKDNSEKDKTEKKNTGKSDTEKDSIGKASKENAVIPYGLKKIKDNAFIRTNSIKTVTIPDSVETIGKNAFYQCENLNKVNLPDSIKVIEHGAFASCSSLKDISIPQGTVSVGSYAFSFSGLERIGIPESVTEIGEGAFGYNINLKQCKIPDTVTVISNSLFSGDASLLKVEMGSAVTVIGIGAFQNCGSLKTIVLPDTVKEIGMNAFSGTSIKEIRIPEGVEKIDDCVFANCTELERVYIPASVKSIGKDAFIGCVKLKKINIPASVEEISPKAFFRCGSLPEKTKAKIRAVNKKARFDYTK